MRKILFFTLVLFALLNSYGQKLSAIYEKKVYSTDKLEPYVQVNFFIRGSSVIYEKNEDNTYSAQVRVTLNVYEDTTVIRSFDHILSSEKFTDSNPENKPNFADIRNIQIPKEGVFTLSVAMSDVHDTLPPSEVLETFSTYFSEDAVSISEISLLESFEKSGEENLFSKYGYNTFPIFYGRVPESMLNLPFYFEIYNTDKVIGANESYILKLYVEDDMTRQLALPSLYHEAPMSGEPISVVINQLSIMQLPSGNYNLVAEVWDDSLLMARERAFFQRTNPKVSFNIDSYQNIATTNTFVDAITDSTLLYQYLSYLYPIASPMEKEFINSNLQRFPVDNLKRYFYSFWLSRNPDFPEKEWAAYLRQVEYVNKTFSTSIFAGYRTDRGRVFLQYGPPDDYMETPYDSHSYPYEIWHYYQMRDQSNVKFVFYNPDLVTDDFELLHSDKYGEPKDPYWQLKISNRKQPVFDVDKKTPDDYWGGSIKDDWRYH